MSCKCSSQVGGSLGNNLFLNSVSELSIITFRPYRSSILQSELARVLFRLRDWLEL